MFSWHFRSGKYEISEADGVQVGTKIVIHLKKDCWRFAMEQDVKGIYSTLICGLGLLSSISQFKFTG